MKTFIMLCIVFTLLFFIFYMYFICPLLKLSKVPFYKGQKVKVFQTQKVGLIGVIEDICTDDISFDPCVKVRVEGCIFPLEIIGLKNIIKEICPLDPAEEFIINHEKKNENEGEII